jgi:autotransporter passenger strand-loop-strand repeat protein
MSGTTVSSGVTVSGFVVSNTGLLTILSGGSAVSTIVQNGGTVTVASGGYAGDTIVSSGGYEQVSAGGIVSGVVLDYTGDQSVGGTAIGTVVEGGYENIIAGGVTSDVLVSGSFHEGFETVSSGGLAISTTVAGGELLYVLSGGTTIGAVIFQSGIEGVDGIASGSVISGGDEYTNGIAYATTITDSGTLEIATGGIAQGGVTFAGTGDDLIIDGAMPTTPIVGFAASDEMDLRDVIYTSTGTANFADGVLTVSAGGQTYALNLPDLPDGTTFALAPDSASGTLVVESSIPCFAAGTCIRTDKGDVAVENLKVGDRVATECGQAQPITWIGHRHIMPARHPRPRQVRPVRIEADAFGPNEPRVPLYLSPDHAIFAQGVLIPVKHLINGETVRQVEVDSITYFHIELAEHAVIRAEGLPVETYLDTGDRSSFAEAPVTELHPRFGSDGRDISLIMDVLGYAPYRIAGPKVGLVKALLAARLPKAGTARSAAASRR